MPETQGTALDMDKVKAAVVQAIDSGETLLDLDEAGCYQQPQILSTDEGLAQKRDQGNAFLKATVTIDFADRQEVVDGNKIKDWLATDAEGNLSLDEAK